MILKWAGHDLSSRKCMAAYRAASSADESKGGHSKDDDVHKGEYTGMLMKSPSL